jgi:hypothetical protein
MNAEEEEEEEEDENPTQSGVFFFLLGLISCSVFVSFYFDIERFWVWEQQL